MAKVQSSKHRKKLKKKAFLVEQELPQKMNYLIMLIGVLVILLGYFVMSLGDDISSLSVTVAPIILAIGYCVIIPFGILYKKKKESPESV